MKGAIGTGFLKNMRPCLAEEFETDRLKATKEGSGTGAQNATS
jgi:hypothetical protein